MDDKWSIIIANAACERIDNIDVIKGAIECLELVDKGFNLSDPFTLTE